MTDSVAVLVFDSKFDMVIGRFETHPAAFSLAPLLCALTTPQESGESLLDAAVRVLRVKSGITVESDDLTYTGQVHADKQTASIVHLFAIDMDFQDALLSKDSLDSGTVSWVRTRDAIESTDTLLATMIARDHVNEWT